MSRVGPAFRVLLVCDGCDEHTTRSDEWFNPIAVCSALNVTRSVMSAHRIGS